MSHFALVTPAKAGVLSLPSRTQTPLSPGKGRATSGGGAWVKFSSGKSPNVAHFLRGLIGVAEGRGGL